MRLLIGILALGFAPLFALAQDAAPATGEVRAYCTQFGPFHLYFDQNNVAGVYRIIPNQHIGAVIGNLHALQFSGDWIENEGKGAIRIDFSEDWSSFSAEYSIAPNLDEWHDGWTGYLPPVGDHASFTIDGETFLCR